MGTTLYDKTEKARFTTLTQSNEKNTVRKTLLLALFVPDETGSFFQRKADSPQDQSPPTSDYDSNSSTDNDTPDTPTKHPDPLGTQSRTDTEGDHLEFRMKVRGCQNRQHISRATHLLILPDHALLKTLEHSTFPILIPKAFFPHHLPPQKEHGWWYVPSYETNFRTCPICDKRTTQSHFQDDWDNPHTSCKDYPQLRQPSLTRQEEKSEKKAQKTQFAHIHREILDHTSSKLHDRVLV